LGFAVPLRLVLGVLVGFGTGWAVNDVRRSDAAGGRPGGGGARSPAVGAKPAASKPCSTDPTVRAIQKQTKEC
jgi:hypothetical protein